MARYFTVLEAERLLPQVEAVLKDAIVQRDSAQGAQDELDEIKSKIRIAGGSRVNPGHVLTLRVRRDASSIALKGALEFIERLGAVVKDLDMGLIDFPTRYDGREVCLCWKMGETGITHWHGTDEGFGGRKPIDLAFLRDHRGEEDGEYDGEEIN